MVSPSFSLGLTNLWKGFLQNDNHIKGFYKFTLTTNFKKMDILEELNKIEEKYAESIEESRNEAVGEIAELHQQVAEETPDEVDRFIIMSADVLGAIYLPHLFWYKLGEYYDGNQDSRMFLQELIKIFTESNFEEEEQRRIKSLLIAYMAKEKEFELDKIRTIIVDKAHYAVKDYFYKLFQFVEKNKKATEMYCEKFALLKDYQPNFELLAMPVTKLKEML